MIKRAIYLFPKATIIGNVLVVISLHIHVYNKINFYSRDHYNNNIDCYKINTRNDT